MPITAIIFDMDGLMLDTEPRYREAWIKAAADCGYLLTDTFYSQLIGRTRTEGEQILNQHFGPTFPLDRFREACKKAEQTALNATPLPQKPGLETLLQLLESHHIPKAVATSTTRDTALPQLKAANLQHRFQTIVTGEEVPHSKPAPDLFLMAAHRLQTPAANCLVLEDSAAGVAAAHAAGMPVYIVPDLIPPSPETRGLATHVFTSLEDVAQHLSQVGKPVRDPGSSQQHIEQPGAPVPRLAPRMISREQPERPEHEHRDQEPVVERRERHQRHLSTRTAGDKHD